MVGKSSDVQWEQFGRDDPYWAVITSEEFRKENLTQEMKEEFFRTGLEHMNHVITKIEDGFSIEFRPKRSVDFGCGTGRVLVNLSKVSEEVVGVDISKSMISEVKSNCLDLGVDNASFVVSTDSLDGLEGEFDFVHSFLCLLHINPKRGYEIIGNLLDRVSQGGVAALHFPIRGAKGKNGRVRRFFRTRVPFAHNFYNLLNGKKFFEPYMEAHHYELETVMSLLEERKMEKYFLEDYEGRYGTVGLFLFVHNV